MPRSSAAPPPSRRFRIVDLGYMAPPEGMPGTSTAGAHGPSKPKIEFLTSAAAADVGDEPRDGWLQERAGVPEAWPVLLNRKQLIFYVGLSWSSIAQVCPVAPVDLGISVVRYDRRKIDSWLSTLPPRGALTLSAAKNDAGDDDIIPLMDGRLAALEKARLRAAKTK